MKNIIMCLNFETQPGFIYQGGEIAHSVECATTGQEIVGSIPAGVHYLLPG